MARTEITDHAKRLANTVVAATGRRPEIHAHYNADETLWVGVGQILDWPDRGEHVALTLNLTDDPLGLDDEEYEIVAISQSRWDALPDVVGDVGLRVRAGEVVLGSGVVIYDGLAPRYEGLQVTHLVVVEPLDQSLRIAMTPEDERPVRWLQLLPVTEGELQLIGQSGLTNFLDGLERSGVEIADLGRPGIE